MQVYKRNWSVVMIYTNLLFCILLLNSCHSGTNENSHINNSTIVDSINTRRQSNNNTSGQNINLKDTSVLFLWRENMKDSTGHIYSRLVVNEIFCKSIPEPIKAAIAFTATFVGNECWWENDEPNKDRTNLKCKILTALNLGCQGSETHLNFLRRWFVNDKDCLEQLKNIPTTPYTSTIQDTFDEIKVSVKADTIKVTFKATGINTRESSKWRWKEIDIYAYSHNSLQLIKINKTNLK